MNLRDKLTKQLEETKQFDEVEVDSHHDSDDSWCLAKRLLKDKRIDIQFSFNSKGTTLKDISIFESKVKTIIDEDNMIKIM